MKGRKRKKRVFGAREFPGELLRDDARITSANLFVFLPVTCLFCWFFLIAMPLGAEPLADYARGVLEEARGNPGDEWFERALEQDPEAWPLVSRVAEMRVAEGDVEAASTLYRKYAATHPKQLGAQLAYVDFLRQSSPEDDFAAKLAGETLEQTLLEFPGQVAVIRRLFLSYEQRGMRERSLKLFAKVSEQPGASAALAAAEMARTIFPGDEKEARAMIDGVFEKAMQRSPGDPVLARAASEHFRSSGRLPKACEMLEKHIVAQPSSLKLRTRLGVLMFASERSDEGEKILLEVLEINPRQSLAHQSLAKLYRKQGQTEKARPHAAELLKIRGGDSEEFVQLGGEFLDADLARDARLLLEKGIFDHPEDAAIAARLAIASRRDPDSRERASRLFREAESLSGAEGPAEEPEFLREFAECLLESGQIPAAEERLRKAIKAYPSEAKQEMAAALRRLAAIWQRENRNAAAARSLLKRADSLDP